MATSLRLATNRRPIGVNTVEQASVAKAPRGARLAAWPYLSRLPLCDGLGKIPEQFRLRDLGEARLHDVPTHELAVNGTFTFLAAAGEQLAEASRALLDVAAVQVDLTFPR